MEMSDLSLRFRFIAAVGSVILVMLVFFPGVNGGFIFDDGPNIVNNPALHLTEMNVAALHAAIYSFLPGGGTRILPELTFALDFWRAGGLDPAAFKCTNIIIHAITTLVLTGFFRQLLVSLAWNERHAMIASIVMALIWALHPIQISSVLYVVQRMQTFATLFVLASLWAYLKMRLAQIRKERSRKYFVLFGLFGVLGLACKEDAAALPVYILLIEWIVLRFEPKQSPFGLALRKWYAIAFVAGIFVYAFVIVPHYWSWGPYPGRDFSSYERLLTQGRVLVMYLWQILLPLPDHMPFYYDDFQVSRGFFDPATTFVAILMIVALMILAWHVRMRRPLLSVGIFLFFAGHFITSNVIGLELAFEHRNGFPLVGAVLALTDIFMVIKRRLGAGAAYSTITCGLILAFLAGGAFSRAKIWGDELALASWHSKIAPESPRAWLDLCTTYYKMSGGNPGNPNFDKAIAACSEGGKITSSAVPLSNVIIYKSINGTVQDSDWDAYVSRLKTVTMTVGNRESIWALLNNSDERARMDSGHLLDAINVVAERAGFNSFDYVRIGYLVLEKTTRPEEAFPYFDMAVRAAPPGDMLIPQLIQDLRAQKRSDWAEKLETLRASLSRATSLE